MQLTESDRLLTRLLAGIHSEKQKIDLGKEGLKKLFSELDLGTKRYGLPKSTEELESALERLRDHNFLTISTNPHITVTWQGLVGCGLIKIPEEIVPKLRSMTAAIDFEV